MLLYWINIETQKKGNFSFCRESFLQWQDSIKKVFFSKKHAEDWIHCVKLQSVFNFVQKIRFFTVFFVQLKKFFQLKMFYGWMVLGGERMAHTWFKSPENVVPMEMIFLSLKPFIEFFSPFSKFEKIYKEKKIESIENVSSLYHKSTVKPNSIAKTPQKIYQVWKIFNKET